MLYGKGSLRRVPCFALEVTLAYNHAAWTWCFQSRSRGISYCLEHALITLYICTSQTEGTDRDVCTKVMWSKNILDV